MTVRALVGKKIGTTVFFRDNGEAVCATAVEVGPCTVTQVKTVDKDGYEAIQLGYGQVRRLNKPQRDHLKGANELYRFLREVEVDDIADIEVGQKFDVGLFQPGDKVDAAGLSIGRGFAGGIKRHGFHGGPKTHGQSDRHRAPGSIGAGSSPGRVVKGHKMAGHMGNARVTVRNLEVVQSDPERNVLLVKGSVPGVRNTLIVIRNSSWERKR
jgi:large subunit ribosomal protein L3